MLQDEFVAVQYYTYMARLPRFRLVPFGIFHGYE